MIVVDSSVAVKWLLLENEEYGENADKILQQTQKGLVICMPELAKYEVGNALIRKQLHEVELNDLLLTFYSIPITFITTTVNDARNTMYIANKYKMTYYGASFVALAQEYTVELVTDNVKHQDKNIEGVRIIALRDY